MSGTNLPQEDYLKLEAAAAVKVLTDAEAILLINNNFGFEASRTEILHDAEIDVTESGARFLHLKKVRRLSLSVSTDWNYIRFNVHTCSATWYYEMINGDLHVVML